MVGSSKILTVSYGTFSCTLEGFDDSFDTMKAIAEYFRDLASDDRYFGAEPPTPDAEMLARIAEREVSRRVEARTEGSGIMLRTGEALPPAAQPAPHAAPAPQAAPEAVPEPAPAPEPIAEPATEAATEPTHASCPEAEAEADEPARSEAPQRPAAKAAAPALQPAAPAARQRPPQGLDSVAAKLQRIRAVVGRQPSFAAEDEEEDIAPAAARPAAGMFDTAPKAEPRQQPQPAEDTAAAKPAAPEVKVEAKPAETAPKADAQEAPAPAHPPRARVVRMRKADFDRALARGEAHRMIETQTGATSGATASDPAEAASEPPHAAAHAGPETEAEAETTAPDERDDPDTTIIEALSRQDEADTPEAAPAAPDAPTDAELSEEAERALLAELAALEREMGFEQDGPAQREMKQEEETRTEAEPPQAEPKGAQAEETAEAEPRETSDAASETEVEAEIGTEAETLAEAQPEARMPAEFEFVPPLPQQNESKEAQAPRDRRAEDGQPSKAPEETQQNGQALSTDEADMSRILSATAARMDDPESGRRREAISQLKAAVAATEAARQLGEVEPREATEEAFRDDLRQAVRPRRPVLPTPEAEQPGEAQPRAERPRPAPLKLVASQRVDLAQEPARSRSVPVRPRRVAVATSEAETQAQAQPAATAPIEEAAPRRPDAVPAASESFGAFAERMGAQELGDLLEAAAAYTAFVEGAEDFSRPQLMERVREVSPEPISREDGLRSFGTLLRQGMLKRVRSGRFAVAGSSRFNPERRAG